MIAKQGVRKIKGKKMFQRAITYLNLYHFDLKLEPKFTAGSLTAFIMLHFECNEDGRILEDNFVLKNITKKYDLPYSSIHRGFNQLFEQNLLKYITVEGRRFIQLEFYDNQVDDKGSMNYFILPTIVLQSNFLNECIKSRDVAGILMMLDCMNSLSRKQTMHGGGTVKRTFKHWIKMLKKTKRNIKNWFVRLQQVITIAEESGDSIKEKEVVLKLADTSFVEQTENKEKEKVIAMVHKSLHRSLPMVNKTYNFSDVQDCTNVLKQELIDPLFDAVVENYTNRKTLLFLINDVAQSMMMILQQQQTIKSIGAFYRHNCRKVIKKAYSKTDIDFQLDVKSYYLLNRLQKPAYMKF